MIAVTGWYATYAPGGYAIRWQIALDGGRDLSRYARVLPVTGELGLPQVSIDHCEGKLKDLIGAILKVTLSMAII